jgi:hypothetical protein
LAERQAGSNPDIQNATANALGSIDRCTTASAKDRAEHDIVDRRPSTVSLSDTISL